MDFPWQSSGQGSALLGLIPGQGDMIPQSATKTRYSQINIKIIKEIKLKQVQNLREKCSIKN